MFMDGKFYCCQEYLQSANKIFGKSLSQIHGDFEDWLSEIVIDLVVTFPDKSEIQAVFLGLGVVRENSVGLSGREN